MKKIVKSFLMIAMTMAVIVGCGKKEQPEWNSLSVLLYPYIMQKNI